MKLSDFPRPPDDNGRGVHWSALIYHPKGRDLDFWLDELQAMQIKWVKLLDDGGGSSLELCQRLLDRGIMPVVRLYRERPNPGHIGGREVDGLRQLIRAGVRYFETNNEPDLPAEWQNNQRPPNWLDIVTDNFIIDADIVLNEGGLLGAPAMGPGGKENLVQKVVERGRKDLFENGCWVAIHNYTLNHPLDYPDDDVNQKGTPLTQEEYDRFGPWAWDNRPLELINQWRAQDKNPGQTVFDDPNCFRAWEVWGKQVQDALGFPVPIISTEGGPVVGWGDDRRYPKVIPSQQAEWQVAITQFLQEEAPEWYFTCCTWLLASRGLGDWNPTWDQMSWYTDAWNERFGLAGQLPVVRALKELPSVVRPELRRGGATLRGRLLRADTGAPLAGLVLTLQPLDGGSGQPSLQVTTDDQGRFQVENLRAGRYRLLLFGAELGQVDLAPEQSADVTLEARTGRVSRILGQVVDPSGAPQPGLTVTLHEAAPPLLVAAAQTDDQGQFVFPDLGPGEWLLRVAPGTEQATERSGVVTDGWSDTRQDVTVPPPPGLIYRVTEVTLLSPEETGNANLIFGQIFDQNGEPLNGVTVRMRWTGAAPDTRFPTVKSGQDPFKPPGYYEFLHTPGVFMVDVVDPEVESQVAENLVTADMPDRSRPISYRVNFQLQPKRTQLAQSQIQGQILGGLADTPVTLLGPGEPQLARLDSEGRFQFTDLPPGIYQLSLEGVGIIAQELVLDGVNSLSLEFPMLGEIQGRVLPPGEPARVSLTSQRFSIRREATPNPEGVYRFANLPPDTYTLALEGSGLPPQSVVCDGLRPVSGPTFDRLQRRHSVIAGQLQDHRGLGVADRLIRLEGPVEQEARTDDQGRFQFQGLPAGEYVVRVVTAPGVRAQVRVDGRERADVLLELPMPAGDRILEHYLFIVPDTPTLNQARLLTAREFILGHQLTVGFHPGACLQAQQVTIIGSPDSETLQALQEANIPFQQLPGDLFELAEALRRLS